MFPTSSSVLTAHTDEVWTLAWNSDGTRLASGGKDKSVVIWCRESAESVGGFSVQHILRGHTFAVGCLAWAPDGELLLSSSEGYVKMWDTKAGVCLHTIEEPHDTVPAICWLHDGTGFITGALDSRRIITWNRDCTVRERWSPTPIFISSLAITPDASRLVAIGIEYIPPPPDDIVNSPPERVVSSEYESWDIILKPKHRFVVYNLEAKEIEVSTPSTGELTSVQISQCSRYALVNQAPDEILLWDINTGEVTRRYHGQKQRRHALRSCFAGPNENFIISGSEDGKVYLWDRNTRKALPPLLGHGDGSVNAVAFNPAQKCQFASCSDDCTLRIWEVPLGRDVPLSDDVNQSCNRRETESSRNLKYGLPPLTQEHVLEPMNPMQSQMHTPVDLLILGAGWTSTFLVELCSKRGTTCAGTSRTGREGTIKFAFDPESDDPTPYTVLPDARTLLITFPIDKPGASQRLVQLYSQTRSAEQCETRFIQLGTTGIWDGGRGATRTSSPESKWYDRHSPFTPTPRANAETELLQLAPQFLTSVINLAGLWGGTRSPRNWVARVASTKDSLREKGSLHMIHGADIARVVLAMHEHKDFSPFLGQRWILTDGRVYDWWDLASAWGTPSSESERGPQPEWVRDLMKEAGVRALPRNIELLGRALDSREIWEITGLSPLYARLETSKDF